MDLATYRSHTRTARLAQGEIAYADVGEGPVALFVHGVFMNGFLWRNVIEAISDERRCIAVDLPAHGGTNVTLEFGFSLKEHADLIVALLDELGIDRVDLIGNDTGGAICQMIAVSYPERLRTLTLTNCDVSDNFPPDEFKGSIDLAHQGELAPLLQQIAIDLELAKTEAGMLQGYESPDYITAELHTAMLGRYRDPDAAREIEKRITSVSESSLAEIEDRVKALQIPTLVVWGDNDKFFEMKWAYWLRDNVAGVTDVVQIKGGKLFFPDERAEELIHPLRHHLAEHAEEATTGASR